MPPESGIRVESHNSRSETWDPRSWQAGTRAWACVAAGVLVYELAAPKGQLLSEVCDRARAKRPVQTHFAIAYIALHLMRRWPRRLDPLYILATRTGR